MDERSPSPPAMLVEPGSGYPVVLVHGLGFDSRQWNPQIPDFAEHYQVFRVEWNYTRVRVNGGWAEYFKEQGATLSFGKGVVPEQRFVDPVADLLALMDRAGIPSTHVVVSGNAFAASMIDLALEHPERVRSLTVATWNSGLFMSGPDSEPRSEWIDALYLQYQEYEELFAHGDIERFVDFMIEGGEFRVDRGPGRSLARKMLLDNISNWSPPIVTTKQSFPARKQPGGPAHDSHEDSHARLREYFERLREVLTPTLAVTGEQSWTWQKDGSDYLAAQVPGARTAVVPGARLYPNLDNPESFNEQVLSFLADVDAPTTT